MQDVMDFNNPIWRQPDMFDEDYAEDSYPHPEEPRAGFRGSRESTAMLTGSDSQSSKTGDRKDSKRGSSASTPRDVVAGFFHDGEDEPSRANGAVTPSARGAPVPGNFYSAPSTPNSSSKLDPKLLLSPRSAATFDRKALFSVKCGKGTRDEPAVIDGDDDGDAAGSGGTSLYEKMFNVQERSEVTTKRRKVEGGDYDDDDEVRKKQKFEIQGGSGVMTDFIRDEKAKDVGRVKDAFGVAAAIDLTDDTNNAADGEEQIKPENDIQVVLGKIELDGGQLPMAIINNVPHLRPDGMWKASKTNQWPPIPIRLVHETHFLIRLVDPIRYRFGTLDPKTAMAIAQLMEGPFGVSFKVFMPSRKRKDNEQEGDMTSQQAPLQIKVLAPKSKAKIIGKLLSHRRIWLRNCPVQHNEVLYNPQDPATFAKTSTLALAGLLGANAAPSTNRTVEEIRSDVMNMFDTIIKTEHLPEAEQPGNIKTEMLSHQKQALFFLTAREEDRIIPQEGDGEIFHLWKPKHEANGKKVYYNVITGTEMPSKPPMMRGGLLADMMGLGKTLSMLSLVVQSADESQKFARCPPPIATDPRLMTNSRATLLICPLSVVSNWEIQIRDHTRCNTLKTLIFHGNNRIQDLAKLRDHDLVITSYQTISSEAKRQQSVLFQTHWFRIILDEAHIIRNPSTAMATATCQISAERRWAVTGTPVQNRLDDLGSLIKFLRIKPFDEKNAFAQYILAPFKTADPEILPKLRLLVDSITLRRLKDNIDLPARRDLIVRLDFSKEEEALYKIFVADSKTKVQLLTSQERLGGRSYAQILKSIMRLRLICAHGEELLSDEDRKLLEGLTKDKAIDLTDDEEDEMPQLSKKQAFEMLELLRQSGLDQCPRCNNKIGAKDTEDSDSEDEEVRADTNTIGHMTACFHIICPACWPEHNEEIEQKITEETQALYSEGEDEADAVNTYTCSYCRNEGVKMAHYAIKQSELDAEAEEKRRIRANPKLARQMGFYRGPHTKSMKLIAYLKQFEQESHSKPQESPIKSVVFSTWTTHLDLIQIALTANNVSYIRLDGSMSRKNRAAAIDDFTNNPKTTVILVTIGAGGLGLNLTAGNKVFVMEPQFNPAAEQQAVDRVHRLGQTREVTIMRFIMRDSFEENMLRQQEKKIELADLAVNRDRRMDRAEAAKAKLESLKSLFR